MTLRSLLLAAALLAVAAPAFAQDARDAAADSAIAAPVLRAQVNVSSDLVRIGDVIDNAGAAAQVPIYRAPDLGTTGVLPASQVIASLRAHQVIGVDTRDIKEVTVTRLARTIEGKEIETEVARALAHRSGLGDAANLALTFDRDMSDLVLDPANFGALVPTAARFEPRSGRFDVAFEIANDNPNTPLRLRFTGTAVEMVDAAVLLRSVERNDVLKASDVGVERRPKAEVGPDGAARDRAIGLQARRSLRAGQALKLADLAKPDLVQRDQSVTLVFQVPGIYLTVRGKALEAGTEGDVVSVMNLQSKRTVTGVVTGRGQVTIQPAPIRPVAAPDATSSIQPDQTPAPVALAARSNPQTAPKAE